MSYQACINCGWESGIHDVRGIRYQHPWLVIHRPSGAAIGCWSRAEARKVWDRLKSLSKSDYEHAEAIATA